MKIASNTTTYSTYLNYIIDETNGSYYCWIEGMSGKFLRIDVSTDSNSDIENLL